MNEAPRIQQGPCFRYAVPNGWRIAEDGQFAVVLVAPDQAAITILVGNAGLPIGYPPAQFVYEKMSQMQVQNLWLGPPRPAPPLGGFGAACELDLAYVAAGIPCRGVARCHVAPAYDSCTMAMTCAAAHETQWPWYAPWLPQVASHVAITSPQAFGAQGVAQQNLMSSMALGQQAQQYREQSQQQWDQVVQQRWDSQDRNSFDFRQNLGNVQTYSNPYGYPAVELSNEYAHYWMNRQGQVVGTNDPGVDPNVGSTQEWTRMRPGRP